jgi:PAS domain S-box-containing protein
MIWVSENVRAVRDADGRMIGCEGMSTDITARKHAERELTASEERFRQLSEAAFEGVIVDVGGHIVQANHAFCEMFGVSPDRVVGSSPADAVAPESLPRVFEYLRSGSETPQDIEVIRKDGKPLVIETTVRRIERDGQEAHLITMHDVTERRAIEDLLRRRDAVLGAVTYAAERFLDGPWEADIDGVLARLGEATDSSRVCLFRNEPGDDDAPLMTLIYEWVAPGVSTTIDDPANARFPYEHDYASWIDELGAGRIIHGSRSDFPEALAKDLEAEDVVSIALVPVFAGDAWWGYLSFDDCVNERVWSVADLELLRTAAGVLGGAIARTNAELALGRINAELDERVVKRTAEVVVAMEEAERARESAERANRAKSEFLSRASHELRTPLNAILGFGQLLEGSALPEDDSESVEEIVRAGRHLLELVNEVLDISRLDADRLALRIEPVSVEGIVHEALDLIGPQALGRGIQLRTNIPPDLHVMADRQRLEQVLLNLLSNAVKFDRQEGTVTVSCEASEERVVLRVADTGPGIAPERMERLFTPFDRLGAETIEGAGAGLGLALSKALVEAMEGSITVETMLDVGTTFAVELPRAEAPAPNERLLVAEARTPAAPLRTVP